MRLGKQTQQHIVIWVCLKIRSYQYLKMASLMEKKPNYQTMCVCVSRFFRYQPYDMEVSYVRGGTPES